MPTPPPALPQWVAAIRQGDRRLIARAATCIENRAPVAHGLLEAIYPFTGHATLIGITGPPGAGKSTLVDQLTGLYRKKQQRVAVIAVDPSSPFTGGAVLGDRIRMQRHSTDADVFIRSMASRGSLGGLAVATAEVALLLDAAGFEQVLVETVGVGQEEVDIAQLAQVTALLLVPGLGDEVQTLKAGILEVADLFLINKADRPGADELEQQLRAALALTGQDESSLPPVVKTVALTGEGLEAIPHAISLLARRASAPERLQHLWRSRLRLLLRDRLLARVSPQDIDHACFEIVHKRANPFTLVNRLLARL